MARYRWKHGAWVSVTFHHLPIWEPGGVDFDAVMAGLKDIGYGGFITVHQAYGKLMGPREAAVETARCIRSRGSGFSTHRLNGLTVHTRTANFVAFIEGRISVSARYHVRLKSL